MKVIVCLYGGAGAGKSTVCADLFAKLKQNNFDVEMNREYIKEWIWEGRKVKPGDQTFFFAQQARKERQYMERGLNVIVTDSPLILTHFYGLKHDRFEQEHNTSWKMLEQQHAICKWYGYNVEHYFLNRPDFFEQHGRFQTKEEAKQYDAEIKQMLVKANIKYTEIDATPNAGNQIMDILVSKYKGYEDVAMHCSDK